MGLVSASVPVPFWASEPEPLTTPENAELLERSNTSAPLSVTLPTIDPLVPPAPISSEPELIVVPPVYAFAPVRVMVLAPPTNVTAPAPVMALESV